MASAASAASEAAAEASEPMLAFSTLNSGGKAVKVSNNDQNGSHKTSTGQDLSSNHRSRWSNVQVIQCLVFLLIVLLIATLCSVFIRPELYFTDYGEYLYNMSSATYFSRHFFKLLCQFKARNHLTQLHLTFLSFAIFNLRTPGRKFSLLFFCQISVTETQLGKMS